MTDDQVLRALLWLAIEDYAGLWETVWELNGADPAPADEHLAAARRAVPQMLDRGWISVHRSVEPDGELTELSDAEARLALADDRSWSEPTTGSTSIRISATPDGERAYEGLARR